MTRSSISSGAAGFRRVSPIPSKPHSIPASNAWFPATGGGWKSCCCLWSPGTGRRAVRRCREKKRRQALRRGSGLLQREGHGGSVGPLPWPGGAASVELVSSFFFYTAPFNSASFPVALGGLTANASLDCLCFAEVFVDKEVRRLISFLYLHLVFVELKGSMPCNSPARFTLLCCCETAAVS